MLKINSREAYDLYRTRRRSVAKEIDQYKLFVKAVNGMISYLFTLVKEAESGVYIKGIGYFFHNKSKNKVRGKNEPLMKRIKRRYIYYVDFYPDPGLEDFYFDFTYDCNYPKKEYSVYFNVIESVLELESYNNKVNTLPNKIKKLL